MLVDCGMFQGSKSEKELNCKALPFSPEAIDSVVRHALVLALPVLLKIGMVQVTESDSAYMRLISPGRSSWSAVCFCAASSAA